MQEQGKSILHEDCAAVSPPLGTPNYSKDRRSMNVLRLTLEHNFVYAMLFLRYPPVLDHMTKFF